MFRFLPRWRSSILLLRGVLVGVLWITVYCHYLLSLGEVDENSSLRGQTAPLTVRGKIISLVIADGDWINLDLVEASNDGLGMPRRWRLGWDQNRVDMPQQSLPQLGESWAFSVRPQAFSAVMNQGSFNQPRYLLSQHITAKGLVLSGQLIAVNDSWRGHLLRRLLPIVTNIPGGDILLALATGERGLITADRWQQLRQTGTGHLVAISGLHLSVVALWCFWLSRTLLCHGMPTSGRRNLVLAQLFALLLAALYALLSGMGVPVQRALIMLLALLLVELSMRAVSPWERWLWALALVLAFDPLAPLSAGCWLSFLALALILAQWRSPQKTMAESAWQGIKQWLLSLWQVQWRLCVGLTLVQALWFGGISIHSVWINLLLVPWFSMLVIPMVLLVLLICIPLLWWQAPTTWVDTLWQWADLLLQPAVWLWQLSDQLPGSWWLLPQTLILALPFVGLALLLWLFRPQPHFRYLSVLLCLPAILQAASWAGLSSKGWQLHVLDVGQGLAVVAQQGHRGLLFDTGAAFGGGFSYSERVILPFLAYRGIRTLDYLLISHGDNDHAGGTAIILQHFPATQLVTDVASLAPLSPHTRACRPAQWQWQRITLRILGPQQASAGNDGSCVLQLDDGQYRALLPGDIELRGEVALLRSATSLASDLLIAPHHGSKTSSTVDFINAVQPRWVVVPAGLNNRWQFPRPEVRQRYQAVGAMLWVTGEQGQISVDFTQQQVDIQRYRADLAPYWYNRGFGFGNPAIPE